MINMSATLTRTLNAPSSLRPSFTLWNAAVRNFAQGKHQSQPLYGSFEQNFEIAPRYFLLTYKLSDKFTELKGKLSQIETQEY